MQNQAFYDYHGRMAQIFRQNQNRTAISCIMKKGNVLSVTFGTIYQYAMECAELEKSYGLKEGDRVLLMAGSNCDMLLGYLVLSYNHLTVVLADPEMPETELKSLIHTCEISAAFIEERSLRLFGDQHEIPVFSTWTIRHGLSVLENQRNTQKAPSTPDTAAIIFSSGTTSKMKPVEVSYDAIIYAEEQNCKACGLNHKNAKFPAFLAFPMTHISGLCTGMCMFLYGVEQGTAEQLNAASLKAGMEVFSPGMFGMVPKVFDVFVDRLYEELDKKHMKPVFQVLRHISSFFRHKLGIKKVGQICLAPFRKAMFGKHMLNVGGGGAPWRPETVEVLQDMGLHFFNVYASTECGFYISVSEQEKEYPTASVGKISSNAYGEVVIKHPDEYGVGEICTKSRFMMNGYYGDPDMTKNAFDEEGYFKTGDSGFIDKNGYLYITGRKKESILLQSGKKISPFDLSEIFGQVLEDKKFAFVGVPAKNEGYDRIHLFIEFGSMKKEEEVELKDRILAFQRTSAPLYPIKKVHFIAEIPVTKIGKTKGYILKDLALEEEKREQQEKELEIETAQMVKEMEETDTAVENDVLHEVISIIRKYGNIDHNLTGMEDLATDLGIDSLGIMEICIAIEEKYQVSIGKYMVILPNAVEIAEYIESPFLEGLQNGVQQTDATFNAYEFPKKRTLLHKGTFSFLEWFFKKMYVFEVEGLEHIQEGKQYIFCPNHETHLDGLWTWTALGKKAPKMDHIGCMAKMEHLDSGFTRFFLTMLGGIPVDRSGDSSQTVLRSLDFIREGNSFLIHPEGTRTRNGDLGPFKNGAANLSIKTGVPIVPVALQGGYEVFPSSAKRMKFRDENHKKCVLRFTFCEPIYPEGQTKEEMTALLRKEIEEVLKS